MNNNQSPPSPTDIALLLAELEALLPPDDKTLVALPARAATLRRVIAALGWAATVVETKEKEDFTQ